MNIYQTNYKKLLQLIPSILEISTAKQFQAIGYMPLNVDILAKKTNSLVIALSHYYKHPSGDMIPDPDMVITIYRETEMVEVMEYQDCFGYRRVYSDDMKSFSPSTKKELNSFLKQWLANLLNQNYQIT